MCLILLAYQFHRDYPLIIAANRDEFYNRPTLPAGFWKDSPSILGGRDLKNMGTWFGVTRNGRFAAVTNYRDPSLMLENAKSRGELVSNFLKSNDKPLDYLNHVKVIAEHFNGFNLLVGDTSGCWIYSKVTNIIEELRPGIHGLSNHLLNTPWPKILKGQRQLEKCLQNQPNIEVESLFKILADPKRAKTEDLPDTGVGLKKEKMLSSIFIKSPSYGTRSSTIFLVNHKNHVLFTERSFIHNQANEVSYEFDISKD